jgi:hypothetical protein
VRFSILKSELEHTRLYSPLTIFGFPVSVTEFNFPCPNPGGGEVGWFIFSRSPDIPPLSTIQAQASRIKKRVQDIQAMIFPKNSPIGAPKKATIHAQVVHSRTKQSTPVTMIPQLQKPSGTKNIKLKEILKHKVSQSTSHASNAFPMHLSTRDDHVGQNGGGAKVREASDN